MATVTRSQNVANSPTNSYPVGIFLLDLGGGQQAELQAVVLVDSAGNEISFSGGLPVIIAPVSVTTTPTPVAVTTGGTGVTVLIANANRKPGSYIFNVSDTDIEYTYGTSITPGQNAILSPYGYLKLSEGNFVNSQAIRMYQASGSSKNVVVYEMV